MSICGDIKSLQVLRVGHPASNIKWSPMAPPSNITIEKIANPTGE